MASIDKTYLNSYKKYREFKDWADKQFRTYYDGYTICIGNWVYKLGEENFDGCKYIPIMSTSSEIDAYLIQKCPFSFIIDNFKAVYDDDYYKHLSQLDLSGKPPDNYRKNRKIVFTRDVSTKYPLHSKPYCKQKFWWLECTYWDWGYNEDTKVWADSKFGYHTWGFSAHIKSIKGVIRHLRNQYLPKGITFTICGRCTGESYLVKIK